MRAAVGGSWPLQAVCKRRPQAAAVGLQRGWEETSVVLVPKVQSLVSVASLQVDRGRDSPSFCALTLRGGWGLSLGGGHQSPLAGSDI